MILENPILRGFHPDPSWCVADGEIYLVTSTFTWVPGLPIYRWTTGAWELIGHALPEAGPARLDEAEDSGGIYAPTLRYIGGKFVLVCTSVLPDGAWERTDGGACSGSFVMTADSAEGPWSDPRWIDGAGGIDPDIFADCDGTLWWSGTRLAENPLWPSQTEIWVRPFDLETASFTGPETVIWHGAVEGVVWSEGPHLFWRDGWYYLLTAEGGTAEEHSIAIARARDIVGPWHGCLRNPVFTHRNLGESYPVQNVGHADLLCAPDGRWWAVMLGVRSREHNHLLGRETFLCPVEWEHGWPVFAPGLGRLPETVDFPGDAASGAGEGTRAVDRGELITPHGIPWSGEQFRGYRVTEWVTAVRWRPRPDESGALALVQDAKNWAKLVHDAGIWHSETCVAGVRTAADFVEGASDTGWLRLDGLRYGVGIGDVPNGDLEASDRSIVSDARWLSTESAGGFTGCVIGLWGTDSWLDPADLQVLL